MSVIIQFEEVENHIETERIVNKFADLCREIDGKAVDSKSQYPGISGVSCKNHAGEEITLEPKQEDDKELKLVGKLSDEDRSVEGVISNVGEIKRDIHGEFSSDPEEPNKISLKGEDSRLTLEMEEL